MRRTTLAGSKFVWVVPVFVMLATISPLLTAATEGPSAAALEPEPLQRTPSAVVHLASNRDSGNRLRISQPPRESRDRGSQKQQDGDVSPDQDCATGVIDEDSGACLERVTDEEMSDPCFPGKVVPGVLSPTGNPVCRDCPNNSSLPGCILIEYDCGHGTLDNATGSCVCEPGWTVSPVTDQCSTFAPVTLTSGGAEDVPVTEEGLSARLDSGALRPGVQLKYRAPPIWQLQDTVMSSIAFALVGLWFFFARRTDLI